jgi:hypothetical protein
MCHNWIHELFYGRWIHWSVFSALMKFRKRRRSGTVGLSRRPVGVSLSKRIVAMAMLMGTNFPLWGACAEHWIASNRWNWPPRSSRR